MYRSFKINNIYFNLFHYSKGSFSVVKLNASFNSNNKQNQKQKQLVKQSSKHVKYTHKQREKSPGLPSVYSHNIPKEKQNKADNANMKRKNFFRKTEIQTNHK